MRKTQFVAPLRSHLSFRFVYAYDGHKFSKISFNKLYSIFQKPLLYLIPNFHMLEINDKMVLNQYITISITFSIIHGES